MPNRELSDRERDRFRDYVEAVQRLCKGRPCGIPTDHVRPDCLYVVDWLDGRVDRLDGITVERVVAFEGDIVNLADSYTDIHTFASIVVAGPFPLGE